jgi:hypothetical protein
VLEGIGNDTATKAAAMVHYRLILLAHNLKDTILNECRAPAEIFYTLSRCCPGKLEVVLTKGKLDLKVIQAPLEICQCFKLQASQQDVSLKVS